MLLAHNGAEALPDAGRSRRHPRPRHRPPPLALVVFLAVTKVDQTERVETLDELDELEGLDDPEDDGVRV